MIANPNDDRIRLGYAIALPNLRDLKDFSYQPQKRSRSWEVTIEQTQEQIADILEQSPSLARSLQNSFELVYQQARSKGLRNIESP